MIAMQNIIDHDKSLLTILFNKEVSEHLKCKVDDYIFVMQSNFNPLYFTIVKADTGYRIRKFPKIKKVYQINIQFKFKSIPEFELEECTYFLNKNNSIRIVLKVNK